MGQDPLKVSYIYTHIFLIYFLILVGKNIVASITGQSKAFLNQIQNTVMKNKPLQLRMCLTANDPNAAVYTAADTGLLLTQVPEGMVKMEMLYCTHCSSRWA